ncbi:MAG: CCE_0567 family metalloprotein [Nitrospiraceae bacterium]|nr:CCE_0567 family metalloprotein [Nitrospiraceae bacterium]
MDQKELEARFRKLARQAAETAMELHDLTEELPGAYLRIEEVARKAFLKHKEWAEAREAFEKASGS